MKAPLFNDMRLTEMGRPFPLSQIWWRSQAYSTTDHRIYST